MSLTLLDIGGSYIKCADGRKIPAASRGSREEISAALMEAVGGADRIGIAIPGPFDFRNGIFLMKHKYEAVYGESFRELAGLGPNTDIRFMHDVNAPLAGALKMMGLKDAALITIGTGLGFSYAIDGDVKENPAGSPAMSLWCAPWKGGILEDFVSARAVSSAYTRKTGKPCRSAYEAAKLAETGDLDAMEVYSYMGSVLGQALRPILDSLGIRILLMGGQISRSMSLMIRPLKSELPGVEILQAPENAVFEGLKTLFE
ncbi:MAG: ROK family protein [Bacteroidales bacterium]|nr:ROK family protein [Bacteroidales bacterium]